MSRKYIDMDKYPRLDHFRHFLTMQQPCVSVTVQVDITDWLSGLKASGCPFFLSFQYAVVKAANRIPEFRQRIVDDKIVEYDYCNPSYIVSLPDDTYRYCNVNVGQPFAQYLKESRVKQDAALHSVHLEEEEGDEGDVIKSGKVKDIELATANIKMKKGEKPKGIYETIISDSHEEEIPIGRTINTKVAGRKLRVVGYYTSDAADDDTYYVHHDTIDADYIQKQKSLTAYADDTRKLKSILDQERMSSRINDSKDKKAYISQRKDQLTSAVVVAGIIMLISLVEMFLMLRSSFLSRIKEIGTLRAIGLKKKDIYRMFTGEILVITFITAIPGILIMYYILTQITKITYYLEGMYKINPIVALISLGIVVVFNLIAGLIPVFSTMRKTPAQILARTDI